jgi:hypothetical protein
VAESLQGLGEVHLALGRYPLAEPLLQRALAVRERALGPDHPDVAETLQMYSTLLRRTQRATEAAPLETRAKMIRAKHVRDNAVR